MNEIIKSVCNRITGFLSPVFVFPEPFVPAEESESETRLREILGVSNTDSDYEVFGILQAIYSFPEYADLFNETNTTCVLSDYERPPAKLNGGTLVGDQNGPAHIEREAAEWPIQKRFTIDYVTDNLLRTNHGITKIEFEVRELDGLLHINWPETLGVQGDVEVIGTNPFQSGFQLQVIQNPIRFPYDLIYDRLRKSTGFMSEILLSQNLVDPFYYAQSPMEGVAVAATALGLNNQAVYG